MNWHSIASFAIGFAMTPVVIGVIGVFAYLSVTYKLDRTLSSAGSATGIGILILAMAIGLVFSLVHR